MSTTVPGMEQTRSGVLGANALRLRPQSTSEQAAERVRELILSGELAQGTPVRETQLAEALAISRNTMREALRLLAREGLIVQDRHRVATVTEVAPADVADIFAVRRLIEFGAVDLVARAGGAPDLGPLREAVEALGRIRQGDKWELVIDADRAFHEALVALSGSARLVALYGQLEGETRLCLSITTRAHRSLADLEEQHRNLLSLLEEGSYERFKDVLGVHLDAAEARVTRVLAGDEVAAPTPGADAVGPNDHGE